MTKGTGKRTRKPVPPDSPAIPARELARDLGVGLQLVYKGCETGEIVHMRLGGRIIIPRSERDRLLSLPRPAAAAADIKPINPTNVVAWEKPARTIQPLARRRRGRPRKVDPEARP
jgi:hypothetical protein